MFCSGLVTPHIARRNNSTMSDAQYHPPKVIGIRRLEEAFARSRSQSPISERRRRASSPVTVPPALHRRRGHQPGRDSAGAAGLGGGAIELPGITARRDAGVGRVVAVCGAAMKGIKRTAGKGSLNPAGSWPRNHNRDNRAGRRAGNFRAVAHEGADAPGAGEHSGYWW